MPEPSWRGRLARPGRTRTVIVVAVMALLSAVAVTLAGNDPWWSAETRATNHGVVPWPEQRPAGATDEPGRPPRVDLDAGEYAFLATQPGSAEPVTYDPCLPLRIVVNERTSFPGARQALLEAVEELRAATGLRIVVEGPTDEPPREDRPVREGDGWAPVLVAWSDPAEWPELEGEVAGVAGSDMVERDGHRWWVTGLVVLDGPHLEPSMGDENGLDLVRAIIKHELAHVVGLGHVDDESELMHPRGSQDRLVWGPGDRAGLALLGGGRCADY